MRRRIPISDKVHQRLKLLRSEKELTQADFAHQLGIFMGRSKKLSVSAVSSWESGSKQPDFTIISSIASFYGVSIQYLTGETDSRTEDVSMKPLFLEDFIVEISVENLPLYERIITAYEHHSLSVDGEDIVIDGEKATSYTFAQDYYFMMGDNRHNSLDSRYWGFVPEDHIVGKPLIVWLSTDSSKSFPANIRWKRFLKVDFSK